jgi:MinD-like ATPase involved in chromosome partitioning or flagellar assembly
VAPDDRGARVIPCLPRLMAARLLFVTGKGGTGKTTIAMAMARAAAAQGRRVVLVEVDNQRPSLTEHFGQVPAYEPVNVAPNLWIGNVTWSEALAEWLGRFVPVQRVVKLVLGNRMVRLFLDVTPGSREVVTFARLQQLGEAFDLVVVDMPASGHAVSFFRVFTRASSLFTAGPVRATMDAALEILAAPSTHLVFASLPEEMVVNETIETWQRLREGIPSLSMPLVVLNQGLVPTLSPGEAVLIERLARQDPGSGEEGRRRAALLRAGRWEAQREQATGEAMERLQQCTTMALLVAPLMGTGPADRVRRMEALLVRSGALLAPHPGSAA